jgi:hypothetical protein
MADEDSVGAEGVPVRASHRWSGDPFPGSGLNQLAQHVSELRTVADDRLTVETRKRRMRCG